MPFKYVRKMKLDYQVNKDSIVKDYLLEIGLSRRFCRKVKLYGKMYINGEICKNYESIKKGDIITLEYEEKANDAISSTAYSLDILYEDEHILIINKPFNLASQPSRLHYTNNVVSYVKKYFEEKGIISNVHIVNRLDYQTSGLMTIAKDGYTHHLLTKEKIITRKYKCIIEGRIEPSNGIINLPIMRKNSNEILREVNPLGKEAITKYQVITSNKTNSLLDIELLTGRTHQIRVHFSYLGYPLVGDKLYGKEDERLMLHCYYLSFINPYNDKKIEIVKEPAFNL